MQLGRYHIHFDALLARIVYRWRLRTIAIAVCLISVIGVGSGLIPPLWRGRADLTIVAAPGATVLLDGRSWPHPVYAGRHTVLATMPDGRAAWADLALQAGQALTLTLPAGLMEPRARAATSRARHAYRSGLVGRRCLARAERAGSPPDAGGFPPA